MNPASISVIIPAYRSAGTIARAIDSVLRQTAEVAQILVIDDGSPDDLQTSLKPFGNAVTIIRKPNGGAASARNLGIESATGDWVAFLDADDYWHPRKIEKQLAIAAQFPEVGVIGCRWADVFGQEGQTLDKDQPLPQHPPRETDHYLARPIQPRGADAFHIAMLIWTSALLVRRSLLANMRFEPGLEPAEDRHLWVRLAESTTVYLLPDVLAVYVQSSDSLSHSDVDRDCSRMLQVIRGFSKLLGPVELRAQEIMLYRRWTASHLHNRAARSALAPAVKRIALQPWSAHGWLVLAKVAWASRPWRFFPGRILNRRDAQTQRGNTEKKMNRSF